MEKLKCILLILCLLACRDVACRVSNSNEKNVAQTPSATEIVRRVDQNRRGNSSYSELTMTIIRPNWRQPREIGINQQAND